MTVTRFPSFVQALAQAFVLATSLFCSDTLADSPYRDPVDGRFDLSGYLAESAFGFLPVPIVITEPAVDSGLGGFGLIFHEDETAAERRKQAMLAEDGSASALLPPNVSAVGGVYTGNGSWFAGGGHMGFFRDGRIRYLGGGGYGDVELDFYTAGDTELSKPISISTEAYGLVQTLRFQIGDSRFFIGPTQRYIKAELRPGSGFEEALPPGLPDEIKDQLVNLLTSETTNSGLGIHLEYDSRDNVFTPTRGNYTTFEWLAFRDAFGSDNVYENYSLESLSYLRLSDSLRLGIRVDAELADTDERLPPFALPILNLRGIPAARYQGTHVGVLESELTWEIDDRWSALGFVGAGRASSSAASFSDATSRVARGIGFRYLIARRFGFHVGIDVARGPEDTVWYIQAGSAW